MIATETLTEAPASADSRIVDIAGVWFKDGEQALNPRTLTIRKNGTFVLEYQGGGSMNGTINVESEEHPDGTETIWYCFYKTGDTLWTGFQRNEEQPQNDLYSGQDGELHFIRAESLGISVETTAVSGTEDINTTSPASVTTAKAQNTSIQTTAKATSAAPPRGVQISRIAGEYFYEVPDPADNSRWVLNGTVSVRTDGTYTYVTNSGTTIKGRIELKSEEFADGNTVWWYTFYPAGEDMWIGIPASSVMEDDYHFLYTGNGGVTRLEVNTGDPPSVNDLPGYAANIQHSGDRFLGTWSVSRLYITIEKFDDAYQVSVKHATSASECTTWEYDCVYNGDYLDSTNGRCVEAVYDEEGNVSSTVRYTNGCAHFRINADGELIWEDLREHWCDDMPFMKLS